MAFMEFSLHERVDTLWALNAIEIIAFGNVSLNGQTQENKYFQCELPIKGPKRVCQTQTQTQTMPSTECPSISKKRKKRITNQSIRKGDLKIEISLHLRFLTSSIGWASLDWKKHFYNYSTNFGCSTLNVFTFLLFDFVFSFRIFKHRTPPVYLLYSCGTGVFLFLHWTLHL